MKTETPDARYARYLEAVRGEPLPLALVDLDALERNVEAVVAPVRERGKTVRVASKSVRSVDLLRRIGAKGGSAIRGVMAYCAEEAAFLAEQGFGDLLIAYPTAQPEDARRIADENARGAVVRAVADAGEHLEVLASAARDAATRIPVVVDICVAYRAVGDRVHVGVRRSPLHAVADIVAFVERVRATEGLTFGGLLAYEAHVAGLGDRTPDEESGTPGGSPLGNAVMRAMKLFVRQPIADLRAEVARALEERGIAVPLFDGGGTGSLAWTAAEAPITEVAAGSGFLASHLFDRYRDLDLEPAAFFALQVVRRPAPGFVTCLGGGFIASGSPAADRLPVPYLPSGLRLTKLEGAGEVQTPLRVASGVELPLGAPVFFRHAKAGELAEHFEEYLLVRGNRVEGRAVTYRGAGKTFL